MIITKQLLIWAVCTLISIVVLFKYIETTAIDVDTTLQIDSVDIDSIKINNYD